MSEVFTVNLDNLTIGEIEELEELTDRPFDELFTAGGKKGKVMRALAFITKRRDDPSFTWEQAGNLRIEMEAGEVNPTEQGAP